MLIKYFLSDVYLLEKNKYNLNKFLDWVNIKARYKSKMKKKYVYKYTCKKAWPISKKFLCEPG